MIFDEIERGSIYAIIPARAGSRGIKNKNIRCLKGYPMIAYSIAAARKCRNVSRVIVSTDSEEYAKIAKYYGAEVPFLRPAEISVDTSTDFEFMEHAITWLHKHEHKLPEFFIHLRPTTPIRKIEIVEDAVERMLSDETATSLRSAHVSAHTPFKWFRLREDGYYKSFVDGMTTDEANNPRQDFEPVYIPDGYVDLLRTRFILESGLLHGDRVIAFQVPESVDVDILKDVEQLEFYLEKNREPILEYLMKYYKRLDEAEI